MSVKYSVAFLVVCPLVVFGPIGAEEQRGGDRNQPTVAEQLFARANAADANGDAALQVQLLQLAVQANPDFELARWHLGQVFFQGKWRDPIAVGRIVARDMRWAEYRERLQAANDTIEEQVELALWCRQAELENEEKWHWYQVLQIAPDHRQALGCLGLKRFQGGLYTPAEIASIQQRQDQEQHDFKRYQREFKRLVNQARRGDPAERDQKLAELALIKEPAAISALFELLVKVNREHRPTDTPLDNVAESPEEISAEISFDEQVGKAAVMALSNMRQHDATLRLLDIAVLAKSRSVRRSAATALRYREPTSYVPLLMSHLKAPIESNLDVLILPSGQISLIEEVYQEGPLSGSREVRTSHYSTRYLTGDARRSLGSRWNLSGNETVRRAPGGRFGRLSNVAAGAPRLFSDRVGDFRRAATRVAQTQQRVTEENLLRSRRNARIREVLETTTEQQLGDNPKTWWTAWQRYNELDVPDALPVYESGTYDDYRSIVDVRYPRATSCFVAGTPVWTQAGPIAIEQIQTSDLVLSQDPISGRLDYRPIVDTTVRPPSAVVELAVNNEIVTTTLGHRFWVRGQGWRMAKFLAEGDRLFSPRGSLELQSKTATEKAVAYNLVVGDFHTYFVGQCRLLVHDNNCPQPILAALPGVIADGRE